jgi:aminoglycoside phosphotransferase family enzyme
LGRRGSENEADGTGSAPWSGDSWSALAEKVEFLRRPESFSEGTTGVEAVETHMSWVFLTDEYAYKLKKPVRFELLNLLTLEDRRRNCDAEVRWNRRLAPDVYLAVVPLGLEEKGRLALGRTERVVDWLVKMRRLPSRRMLDHLISSAELRRVDVLSVAETLAAFYRRAPRVHVEPKEYRARFVQNIGEIVRDVSELSPIPKTRIAGVSEKLLRFVEHGADLLEARALEGKVVEAHGDLRPEHVCLLPQPVIIDCLEFESDLRVLDPADELSFLSLECELAGGPAFIEELLFEIYSDRTGDRLPRRLIPFYKAFRAFLRAKIAIWHLRDRDVKNSEKWISKTDRYLETAERLVSG